MASNATRRVLSNKCRWSLRSLPLQRPASTLTLAGSGDIFDVPERPLGGGKPSFLATLQHRYIPSPFCPPGPSGVSHSSPSPSPSSSSVASLSSWAARASARTGACSNHTATHAPLLLLDGPARPTQRLVVITRNRHSSSSASSKSLPYISPIPEIFDGPARPRLRRYSPITEPTVHMYRVVTSGIICLVGLAAYQFS